MPACYHGWVVFTAGFVKRFSAFEIDGSREVQRVVDVVSITLFQQGRKAS